MRVTINSKTPPSMGINEMATNISKPTSRDVIFPVTLFGRKCSINHRPLTKLMMICGTQVAKIANPVQVILAKSEHGQGILGVIDGFSPKGVEKMDDVMARKEFLRNIGYKL